MEGDYSSMSLRKVGYLRRTSHPRMTKDSLKPKHHNQQQDWREDIHHLVHLILVAQTNGINYKAMIIRYTRMRENNQK